ncbi:MAG: HAD family phosphatase [Muribaculaceae bacterium]|nr:HAD family phosphatase [Muribaculaceae bacterium]
MDKDRIKTAFLFDLDGVIIDSESEYTRIWSLINEEFPTGIENFATKIKGTTLSKILTENYSDSTTREKVKNRLHELESQMVYNFLPGAKDFLATLKQKSIPCVLVTSSDNKKMEHLWEEQPSLKQFFTHIITGDQVKSSKPSPEGYLLGASLTRVDPKNCVVFEDSLQGVMAGKNSGAYVVGMAGTLPVETLAPYSHIVVEGFDDLDIDELILTLTNR